MSIDSCHSSPFVIAELGINHNGEFDVAKRLIEASADSGVNGIKFQYRNLKNSYSHLSKEIGDEILNEEIRRNYLSPDEILELVDYSHELNIQAGISFFNVTDLDDYHQKMDKFDFFKVPSVEFKNVELINTLLGYDKTVYLSLGCQTELDVDTTLPQLIKENWVLLHCVSNYPVMLFNAKLGYLNHMAKKWKRPFGYSSHDESWEACVIALAMGASVLERHITFDKLSLGLDHTTSSTPDEFKKIRVFADNMSAALKGDGPRVPNQGEKLNLQNLGRSFYVKETILPGETVTFDKVGMHSPQVGLDSAEMKGYIGKPIIKALKKGDVVNRSAYELPMEVSEAVIDFSRRKKLSLPVRLHDFKELEKKFPIGTYEFHLSYKEVSGVLGVDGVNRNNSYSVHLPDYINSFQLMDPFSENEQQAKTSLDLLQRTVNFARDLQDLVGKSVPVVGSFSVAKEDFYYRYSQLFFRMKENGVSILPQWLPPIAWYFGGSVRLDVFNSLEALEQVKKYKMPICMDVCHLAMGEAFFGFKAESLIDELHTQIEHIHIADSIGVDGEGINFGEGDKKNIPVLKAAMDMDCMKVIEVWQGHLNGAEGFANALNSLYRIYA